MSELKKFNVAAVSLLCLAGAVSAAKERLNILFVMVDDKAAPLL